MADEVTPDAVIDLTTFAIRHPAHPEHGEIIADARTFAEFESLGWERVPTKGKKSAS